MLREEEWAGGRGGGGGEGREVIRGWIKRTFEISIKRDFDTHGTRPEGKFTECSDPMSDRRYERGSFRPVRSHWSVDAGEEGVARTV